MESEHYLALLRHCYIWAPGAVIYRRGAIEAAGGFNERMRASEDYDLYLSIVRNFPIRCCGDVILEYRRYGENISCDSAMMLKASVSIRRAEWRHVWGSEPYRRAWREGIREVQGVYGGNLMLQVRAWLRGAGDWRRAAPAMSTLQRYYPVGGVEACLPEGVAAQLRRTMRGVRLRLSRS